MKVLLDENVPATLGKLLIGHECSSVIRLGWRGTKNGTLMSRAERDGFEVLITLDDDIELEQNMRSRQIAILVLKPAGQGKRVLADFAPLVLEALQDVRQGTISTIQRPLGQ